MLPAGLRHMDEDEQALAQLPTVADRMKYHTKRLRIIQYVSGAEGVRAYKTKHPEARGLLVFNNPIAFQPKPKGYDAALCSMVDAWFTSDIALAQSNRAAVEAINSNLGTRLDPNKHFSIA